MASEETESMYTDDKSQVKPIIQDWDDLEKEYTQLQLDHEQYKKKLDEMVLLQKKCLNGIAHHRYRIKSMQDGLKKIGVIEDPECKSDLKDLNQKMGNRKNDFREMEDILPHKNGIYLSIILGQVNVSLLNKADKYIYKHDYERFKVTVSYITLVLSIVLLLIQGYRWLDAFLHFLFVWYYCTLTIRENILIVNGSRIKGWWVTHHFISTVCAGITLIWPDGYTYRAFRTQETVFCLYLSCMYVMQFFYQRGSLYRLRALGEGHEMDLTVEGFMSWMWRGLAFLLPFLFIGYFFQMYNAYALYRLIYHPQCTEWQVYALCIIHFILSVGNITTSLKVVKQKIQSASIAYNLQKKYNFASKQ